MKKRKNIEWAEERAKDSTEQQYVGLASGPPQEEKTHRRYSSGSKDALSGFESDLPAQQYQTIADQILPAPAEQKTPTFAQMSPALTSSSSSLYHQSLPTCPLSTSHRYPLNSRQNDEYSPLRSSPPPIGQRRAVSDGSFYADDGKGSATTKISPQAPSVCSKDIVIAPALSQRRNAPPQGGVSSNHMSLLSMSHQSLHFIRECLWATQWISDMAKSAKAMVLRQDEELAGQLSVCERVDFGDHNAGE